MSHTGKLYKYYLKKSLWRSWRLWGTIALCWAWWIVFSWISAQAYRETFKKVWTEQELAEEFGWKGTLEKSYQGGLSFDEDSIKYWEEQAAKAQEPEKQRKYREFAQKLEEGRIHKSIDRGTENLSKEAQWKVKYSTENSPFYEALTEFSSRQAKLDQGGIGGKIELVHHLSLWNMSGIILGSFLAYNLLSSLFVEAKKNGEDAMVLNLSPGVERSHLFFGKTLALLSNLGIYALLGFVLPYTILLLAFGPGITSWGTYLLFVFWTVFLGPVLFLLFPAALYLSASLWGMVGGIIQFILHYFSIGWMVLNMAAKSMLIRSGSQGSEGFFDIVAKIEYYYYYSLVHIAFAVILGGLLLIFYYSYYQQEDLS